MFQSVVDTLTESVFGCVSPFDRSFLNRCNPPGNTGAASLTLLYRLLFLMYGRPASVARSAHALFDAQPARFAPGHPGRLNPIPSFSLPTRLAEVTWTVPLTGLTPENLPQRTSSLQRRAFQPRNTGPSNARLYAYPDASVGRPSYDSLGAAAVNGSAEKVLVNFRDPHRWQQLGTLYERLLEWRPVISRRSNLGPASALRPQGHRQLLHAAQNWCGSSWRRPWVHWCRSA